MLSHERNMYSKSHMKKLFLSLITCLTFNVSQAMDKRVTLPDQEELEIIVRSLNARFIGRAIPFSERLGGKTILVSKLVNKVTYLATEHIAHSPFPTNPLTEADFNGFRSTIIKTILHGHPDVITALNNTNALNYNLFNDNNIPNDTKKIMEKMFKKVEEQKSIQCVKTLVVNFYHPI
jgi:hypothetical protein